MKRLFPLLALLVASCGEVKTGGFETSDLQARVQRRDGTPVASARVWLVRSRGDSAPALALDSSWTDASGLAHFAAPADGPVGLGLDVQREDSMGIAPSVFNSSSNASVLLAPSQKLSFLSDSNGTPRCFVPGSHFASTRNADGSAAVIALPQGTWNLAIARGVAAPFVTPFVVAKDTTVTVGALGMDSTPARQIAVGPDFFLDSFRIGDRHYARDTSFSATWLVRIDTFSGSTRQRTISFTQTADSFRFESKPVRFLDSFDSLDGLAAVEMKSVRLPDSGVFAIRLRYTRDYLSDSGRNLGFHFVDSNYNGAVLNLNPRMRSVLDSSEILGFANFRISTKASLDAARKMTCSLWYFRWTPRMVEISNEAGLVGIVTSSIPMDGPPTLRIALRSYLQGPPAAVDLASTRLFRPR